MEKTTGACTSCGADITRRHGNAKRCAPCSKQAKEQAQAHSRARSAPCVVDDQDCVPGRLRGGMCDKHYRRQRSRGTTDSPWIDNLQQYNVTENGCWQWSGPLYPNGYGHASMRLHGTTLAHRIFFTEHVGPIPDGLDLDHLCRNRACVNPEHLEPVARGENLKRGEVGYGARTTCRRGLHDITQPGSWYWGSGARECIHCWRIRYRQAGSKYRAKD